MPLTAAASHHHSPSPAAAAATSPSKAQLKQEVERLKQENKRLKQQLGKRPREEQSPPTMSSAEKRARESGWFPPGSI